MKNQRCRVKCAPEIESEVCEMGPGERRQLALKFRRLAHQLEFSAMILEMDAAKVPKPRLKWLPTGKLKLN